MAFSESKVLAVTAIVLGTCGMILTGLFVRREFAVSKASSVAGLVSDRSIPGPAWELSVTRGHYLGKVSAPHTLLVFTDYQCPACRDFENVVHEILSTHSANVRVVVRYFPLRGIHPEAEAAANAAECAASQDLFAKYHDALFANQDSLGLKPWSEIAKLVGIRNVEEFARCVTDNRFSHRVAEDLSEARSLGLIRTPSVILDGMLFGKPPSVGTIDTILLKHKVLKATASVTPNNVR